MAFLERIPQKSIDTHDANTWKPRGLFLNIDSRNVNGYDFDMLNNYQKKESDGGLGAINLVTGGRDTTLSGLFIGPPPGMNMYLKQFTTIVEVLNPNDVNKNIDDVGGDRVELWVRGQMRYHAATYSKMQFGATSNPSHFKHLHNVNLETHSFRTDIVPAGLYKSNNNDKFHLKFGNDQPINSSYYMRIHYAFFIWLTVASEEE